MAIITTGSTASELEIDNKRAKIVLSDISGNIVEPINSTPIETDYGLPVRTVGAILSAGIGNDGSYPDPYSYLNRATRGERSTVTIDGDGNLQTRGATFSDEGSWRYDFSGTSLYKTYNSSGSFTFTLNSKTVTASGAFDFLVSEIDQGGYIKLSNQDQTFLVQIDFVINSTTLILKEPYPFASSSYGSIDYSEFFYVKSAGSSVTVANSLINLISSGVSGEETLIQRDGDYHPIKCVGKISISSRNSNQEVYFGMFNDDKNQYAKVYTSSVLSNTQVYFVTSSSSDSTDKEISIVNLPNGVTTAKAGGLRYQIDIQGDKCTLVIDENICAVHYNHIPSNYTDLVARLGVVNTGATSSTTVTCDYMFLSNENTTEITQSYRNNAIGVKNTEDKHYMSAELTTTTSSAGQTLLSYTVPNGKRIKITGWDIVLASGSTATGSSLVYIGKNTMGLNSNNWTQDGNILAVSSLSSPTSSGSGQNRWQADFGIAGINFGAETNIIKILVNPSSANPTLIHYATLYFILF